MTGRHPDLEQAPPPASKAAPANVDRQMAKGALWMVLGRLLDRVLGLVSIVILARLLSRPISCSR